MSDVHIPRLSPQKVSFVFLLSMWWRIFYGVLRIILGFVLLKLVGSSFTDLLTTLMTHEITLDPTDALFQFIYTLIEDHSFTVTYFVAAYLLFWGTIDVVLSVQLLRNKLWAFPVSMWLMILFVLYATYRVLHTHSLLLLGVIVLDIFIINIVYQKYRLLKKREVVPPVEIIPT